MRFNTAVKAAIRADGGLIKARWRDLPLAAHFALQVLLTTAVAAAQLVTWMRGTQRFLEG